ncbi:MAG: pantoate--beta-alanine ligase [Eudoraea sp.]|nr:pantoate--beta-alanine ligase [Eudoraea sp.]
MKPIHTLEELREKINRSTSQKSKSALVPTMGALHEGHLSLIRKAVRENELVVISIFVNPTQFDNKVDLENYPRDLATDLKKIAAVSESCIVFTPDVSILYPNGLHKRSYDLKGLDTTMEGAHRKGHFQGVCTIVESLLTVVAPDVAYFGEKDFQQLQIIRLIVSARKIPVRIIGCPIVREKSGLAMSSRNQRLTESSRAIAANIYRILKTAKQKFGMKSATQVAEWVQKEVKSIPALKMEYFEIADEVTLRPVVRKRKNRKYRAFIAVYIDGIRLIDNIAL